MARYSGATWRGPVPNMDAGQMNHPVKGLILHIEQGTESGTDAWFHNPVAKASAHFGSSKDGQLDQWVDTDDKAWAIVAGNRNWISIENEGNSGDQLTDAQLTNCARILAWLSQTENVPLQITDDPNGQGLGYHGMGGQAWGGHLDCPGQPIVDQRAEVVRRASQMLAESLAAEHGHPALAEMARAIKAQSPEA